MFVIRTNSNICWKLQGVAMANDKCVLCGAPAKAIARSKFLCIPCFDRFERGKLRLNELIILDLNKTNHDQPHVITAMIETVFGEIHSEIERAQSIHPKPSFAALVEEIGEVAMDIQHGNDPRPELVQVAAVAVRLIIEQWG